MILLWLACTPADDTTTRPPRQGPRGPDDTEEVEDRNEPPEDTGVEDTADTGEPIEDPEPTERLVCYPGADEAWDTCLEVVAWDAAWGSDYDYPDPYNGSSQYVAPLYFLDLKYADPGLALAPNFVLDEFMQEWKGRFAVYQPHAVQRMQDIRDRVGGPVTVNSGYRNVTYNDSVGGAEYSRHIYGDACDFKSSGASLGALGEMCEDLGAGYVGYYDSHVHCDWRDDPLEEAFYEAGRSAAQHPVVERSARLVLGSVLRAPAEGWDEGEPLREWRAWDASGALLVEATGRSFDPPDGAVEVEVAVGRELVLKHRLE